MAIFFFERLIASSHSWMFLFEFALWIGGRAKYPCRALLRAHCVGLDSSSCKLLMMGGFVCNVEMNEVVYMIEHIYHCSWVLVVNSLLSW